MPDWLTRLREMVWPAVIAAVLTVVSIILALVTTENPVLVVSLGLGAITMALLATRE